MCFAPCRRLGWSIAIAATFVAATARGQFVNDVDGLFEDTRIFNGFPSSTLTITNDYPATAIIDDQNLGVTGGQFANRHDLIFSADAGSTPRSIGTQDSFDVSVDLTLDAVANSPRKEAGLRVNHAGFDGLFIVNSDTQEIAAFSDPLIFYSFNTNFGISYTVGQPINMRMIYTAPDPIDPSTNPGTIEYRVNYGGQQYTSGPLEFTNLEKGILTNSEFGVYAQGGAAAGNPTDGYTATYANFVFGDGSVAGGVGGDYNNNGVVDAADYTVWRDHLNQTFTLEHEVETPDMVTIEDYNYWKDHFGETAPTGAGAISRLIVPEPATVILAGLSAIGLVAIRRRSS